MLFLISSVCTGVCDFGYSGADCQYPQTIKASIVMSFKGCENCTNIRKVLQSPNNTLILVGEKTILLHDLTTNSSSILSNEIPGCVKSSSPALADGIFYSGYLVVLREFCGDLLLFDMSASQFHQSLDFNTTPAYSFGLLQGGSTAQDYIYATSENSILFFNASNGQNTPISPKDPNVHFLMPKQIQPFDDERTYFTDNSTGQIFRLNTLTQDITVFGGDNFFFGTTCFV